MQQQWCQLSCSSEVQVLSELSGLTLLTLAKHTLQVFQQRHSVCILLRSDNSSELEAETAERLGMYLETKMRRERAVQDPGKAEDPRPRYSNEQAKPGGRHPAHGWLSHLKGDQMSTRRLHVPQTISKERKLYLESTHRGAV